MTWPLKSKLYKSFTKVNFLHSDYKAVVSTTAVHYSFALQQWSPTWRQLKQLKGSSARPALFVPPGSIGRALTTAPKCHCSQMRLPRMLRAWPTGAIEPGSGLLRQHKGAVVEVVPMLPGRMVKASHLAGGNSGLQICRLELGDRCSRGLGTQGPILSSFSALT